MTSKPETQRTVEQLDALMDALPPTEGLSILACTVADRIIKATERRQDSLALAHMISSQIMKFVNDFATDDPVPAATKSD
ncbi:hypothetical protein ASD31_03010 [Rhizobium sp. Root482]|nr:hypothetical protein ASD31_03010 [Rhizobium sp. Root482]